MSNHRTKLKKSRGEDAKRRRPKGSKISQSQRKPQEKKQKPVIVDLTTEEEEQEDKENNVEARMETHPQHLDSDDYFTILNLPRTATESEVKRAYRKLAVQWHPDKNRSNPQAEAFFKKISEAYDVLSDKEKRKAYESYGKTGLGTGATPSREAEEHFGFTGHQWGREFSMQHARDIFDAFFSGQDPFEAFFGGGRQRRRSSQRRVDDPFESMGFGSMGMGMGMNMRGFGSMGGMSMMNSFFSDDFGDMSGSGGGTVFTTSTSSSSSTFTDRTGHVITQKTTTTTVDGRTETVTEEFRDGKLVNSTSSSRLADAGRMQLEGRTGQRRESFQRRGSRNVYPMY